MSLDDEDEELDEILGLPEGLGVAPLLALTSVGLRKLGRWLDSKEPIPEFWGYVKVVHADDLRAWTTFPRCQDFDTLTYGDYWLGVDDLAKARKRVKPLLRAKRRLAKLDTGAVVAYHTEAVPVPRSLLRRLARLRLEHERLPGTWLETRDGEVSLSGPGDLLVTRSGWRRRWAVARSVGPSRVVHAQEIARLTGELAAATAGQLDEVARVEASRFRHPVLFVSHRWESQDHPDPAGEQLRRLRALKDCWIIYDYTSFPQLPRTESEEAQFQLVLDHMIDLLRNVVILASPDYLTRGWLVFEYLVASLGAGIVCDEVANPDFVSLGDWSATSAPVIMNVLRDGWESQLSNSRNDMLLAAVNRLLPVYSQARFRTEHDSTKVTGLLRALLKQQLPPRKKSPGAYGGGEWETVSWTDEDLDQAFRGEVKLRGGSVLTARRPFETRTPATLEEAVARKYKVSAMTWKDRVNPFRLL